MTRSSLYLVHTSVDSRVLGAHSKINEEVSEVDLEKVMDKALEMQKVIHMPVMV